MGSVCSRQIYRPECLLSECTCLHLVFLSLSVCLVFSPFLTGTLNIFGTIQCFHIPFSIPGVTIGSAPCPISLWFVYVRFAMRSTNLSNSCTTIAICVGFPLTFRMRSQSKLFCALSVSVLHCKLRSCLIAECVLRQLYMYYRHYIL